MKTKLEKSKTLLDNDDNLQCPLCHKQLNISDNSVKCINNHTFNINKKGIISIGQAISDKLYNKEMFISRQNVLNSGIYDPVFETLRNVIPNESNIVDAGCGEGTYLNKVYHESNRYYGVDLAKEGLNLASDYDKSTWILADLANLPFNDKSIDVILNILSPANYDEFNRVLKDDGILVKVIVNKDYLKEVRESTKKISHSNEDVITLLSDNFDIIKEENINYTESIDEKLSEDIFKMTPLSKNHEYKKVLSEITIDLKVVLCRKKG